MYNFRRQLSPDVQGNINTIIIAKVRFVSTFTIIHIDFCTVLMYNISKIMRTFTKNVSG